MLKVNQPEGEVFEQLFIYVTFNDISYSVETLKIQNYHLAQGGEVILFGFVFEGESCKVDGVYLNGTNLECGAANGIEISYPCVSTRAGLSLIQL